MPAYSVEIPRWKCETCGRPATRQVFNSVHASSGHFCRTHAATKVDQLNRSLEERARIAEGQNHAG